MRLATKQVSWCIQTENETNSWGLSHMCHLPLERNVCGFIQIPEGVHSLECPDHTINLLFTHHWPRRPGVLIVEKEQICGFILSGLNKLASNTLSSLIQRIIIITVCSKHVSQFILNRRKLNSTKMSFLTCVPRYSCIGLRPVSNRGYGHHNSHTLQIHS